MARRALIAATICSDVACFSDAACFGAAELSPQKPRALMMSVTVCGFASALSSGAGFAFGGGTIWASAEASCRAAAILVRGVRTGSEGLLSADLLSVDFLSADLLSADLAGAAAAGAGLSSTAGAASSSSSFDLLLYRAAREPDVPV